MVAMSFGASSFEFTTVYNVTVHTEYHSMPL
jgi:hypothetical protein